MLSPADRVSKVVDYLLTSYQPDFAVVHSGQLLGVVRRDTVLQALADDPSDAYVAGLMDRNVLRLEARQSLADAQEIMAEQGRVVAAVFTAGRFLGLVSLHDLREALRIVAFLRLHEERYGGGGGSGKHLGTTPAA